MEYLFRTTSSEVIWVIPAIIGTVRDVNYASEMRGPLT